jgi:AcrR family transcriptional regulator
MKKAATYDSPLAALEPRRRQILEAAYDVLADRGYAGASTLEIATRARVSKRELYAEFGNKAGILSALIEVTAARMYTPLAAGDIASRGALAEALQQYGRTALRELTSAPVLSMNRLAIAEAGRSNELSEILERAGREPNRRALVALMTDARAKGLLGEADPSTASGQFFSLLIGDLMLRLLLGVIRPPGEKEIERRADAATAAVLALYPASTT